MVKEIKQDFNEELKKYLTDWEKINYLINKEVFSRDFIVDAVYYKIKDELKVLEILNYKRKI